MRKRVPRAGTCGAWVQPGLNLPPPFWLLCGCTVQPDAEALQTLEPATAQGREEDHLEGQTDVCQPGKQLHSKGSILTTPNLLNHLKQNVIPFHRILRRYLTEDKKKQLSYALIWRESQNKCTKTVHTVGTFCLKGRGNKNILYFLSCI